jgi:hypothetical protein
MNTIPITWHCFVTLEAAAQVEQVINDQDTLEAVLDWGRTFDPPPLVLDIVTQDEFNLDVIVPVDEGLYLVYAAS